jgi:hypothetical protein
MNPASKIAPQAVVYPPNSCGSCRYLSSNMALKWPGIDNLGTVCVYYPPVIISFAPLDSYFPPVNPTGTCGFYQTP